MGDAFTRFWLSLPCQIISYIQHTQTNVSSSRFLIPANRDLECYFFNSTKLPQWKVEFGSEQRFYFFHQSEKRFFVQRRDSDSIKPAAKIFEQFFIVDPVGFIQNFYRGFIVYVQLSKNFFHGVNLFFKMAAATLRSSRRPLVQDPMNT